MASEKKISQEHVMQEIREQTEIAEELIAMACELHAQLAHLNEQLNVRLQQSARAVRERSLKAD